MRLRNILFASSLVALVSCGNTVEEGPEVIPGEKGDKGDKGAKGDPGYCAEACTAEAFQAIQDRMNVVEDSDIAQEDRLYLLEQTKHGYLGRIDILQDGAMSAKVDTNEGEITIHGYSAVRYMCRDHFQSLSGHMCSSEELQAYGVFDGSEVAGWVSDAPTLSQFLQPATGCNGFTSNNAVYPGIVAAWIETGVDESKIVLQRKYVDCNQEYHMFCCR